MENLTGSEAIYGFVGWLTTREEKTVMSSSDNCAGIPELVTEFCETNNLAEPREDWHEHLTHPA